MLLTVIDVSVYPHRPIKTQHDIKSIATVDELRKMISKTNDDNNIYNLSTIYKKIDEGDLQSQLLGEKVIFVYKGNTKLHNYTRLKENDFPINLKIHIGIDGKMEFKCEPICTGVNNLTNLYTKICKNQVNNLIICSKKEHDLISAHNKKFSADMTSTKECNLEDISLQDYYDTDELCGDIEEIEQISIEI